MYYERRKFMNNQIENNIVNEIRSKVDIVDIISSYLPLVQKVKDNSN